MRKMEDSIPVQEQGSKGGMRSAVKKRFHNRPYLPFVLLILIILIIITAMWWNSIQPPPPHYATPYFTRSATSTAIVWTVFGNSGWLPLPRSFIYVQIINATGFVMTTTPLADANGRHGFTYSPAGSGNYIGVGDVFTLSKDYASGCELRLVTANGQDYYARLII